MFFVAGRAIGVAAGAALTFGDGEVIILAARGFYVEEIRALAGFHAVRVNFFLVSGVTVVHG